MIGANVAAFRQAWAASSAHGVPTASVQYGYQSPQSVEQAVIDAGYKGPTLNYHP